VDTLGELEAEGEGELFLILGTDNLAGLPAWRAVERVLALARPIVILRDPGEAEPLAGLAGRLSAKALERLARGLVRESPVEVSSTGLRGELHAGRRPGALLPPALEEYIRSRGLYRERD